MTFQLGNQLAARPLVDRFTEKVERGPSCWRWTGASISGGYGMIRVEGRSQLAHRVAWILAHGSIPEGMEVCHRCDNPPCVNPEHLFLGTHHDNMRDRDNKGRHSPVRGAAQHKAKLTPDSVREIRQRHAQGETLSAIARSLAVFTSTVARVVARQTWGHVT